MPDTSALVAELPPLGDIRPPSLTDQVFDALHARVVDLSLPPGTKLSETEVAAQLGVSRQPVRDAFYRLSQIGFLQIRPQRATIVTPISKAAVTQAWFIRSALEDSCIRTATPLLTTAELDALDALLTEQAAAIETQDLMRFHALDDQFHRDICRYAGLDFVWTLIKETKGHMDRARFLSLTAGSPAALAEHRQITAAFRARDTTAACAAMRQHLDQIKGIVARLEADRPGIFVE